MAIVHVNPIITVRTNGLAIVAKTEMECVLAVAADSAGPGVGMWLDGQPQNVFYDYLFTQVFMCVVLDVHQACW